MNRREMLQYLASVASAPAALTAFGGCAMGSPNQTSRPGGRDPDGGSAADAGEPGIVPRHIRAEHLYICSDVAPGVDIREFGFKHAALVPAKAFADRNGMASVPRMRTALSRRLRDIPDRNFRGPIVLDMEGSKYAGGLKSTVGQQYEAAARRMNSALAAVHRIIPNAIVSTYSSPFMYKTREDFAAAQRAVQRLHGQTFLNPSLYDTGPKEPEAEQAEADIRRRYVAWSREIARQLGFELVLPMLHFRYKGAGRPGRDHGLEVIPKDEYINTQVLPCRDGGAQGVVIWHADMYRKRVADNPEIDVPRNNRIVIDRVYGDVSMDELAQIHRDALQQTRDAFLSDPDDTTPSTNTDSSANTDY